MSLSKITQIVRSSRTLFRLAQPSKLVIQNVVPKRSINLTAHFPYSMSDGAIIKVALAGVLVISVIGTYIMFPYEGFGNADFLKPTESEAILLASVILSKLTPINAGPDGQLNGFSLAQHHIEAQIGNLNKSMQSCSDADEQKELQNGKKLFSEMLEYIIAQRQEWFPGQTCMNDVYLAVGKEAMKRDLDENEVNKIAYSIVGSPEELQKKADAYFNEKANESALSMRPKLLKLRQDPEAFGKLEKLLAALPQNEVTAMKEKVSLREPEGEMKELLEKMLVLQKLEAQENPPTLDEIRQSMRGSM